MKFSLKKLTNSDLFIELSNTEKVLFILYDYPKISKKNIINKECYPVTIVTSVTSVTSNIYNNEHHNKDNNNNNNNKDNNSNNGNNSNRVTPIFNKDLNKLKVILNRLFKRNLIKKNESTALHTYELTSEGIITVEDKYLKFKIEIDNIKKLQNQESRYENISDSWKELFDNSKNLYSQTKQGFFKLDLKELSKYYPDLTNELYDNPENTILLGESILSNMDLISSEKVKLIFTNPHKASYINITKIRSKNINRLINIVGEIRSRGQTRVTVQSALFECPSCGNKIIILQLDQKFKEPTICGCGRKGKFKLLNKEISDSLKIVVNDLYENLTTNEVPEEINVLLKQDVFNFSKLNEGDRIRIIAIPKLIPVLNRDGSKSIEEIKVLECYGIDKLEEDFDNAIITQEDESIFKEIYKDPIKWHQKEILNDLNDIDLPATVSILSLYGSLNILFAGQPGGGKSEILRRLSKVALRGAFVDCGTSRPAGIIGAATKNPFTGKFSIDGGVLRPMHPGGISVLDEINRDNDKDIQKTILGVMSSKILNIHKANIKLNTECDVNIWCTVNPIKVSEFLPLYDIFGLLHPLWDRFDLVIYFNNYLNSDNISLLAKLLEDNKNKWEIDNKKLEIIKKYQIRARTIKVEFDKNDYILMAKILRIYFNKIDIKASHRRIGTIKKLIEAICKMNHRCKPIKQDYVFLERLINDINISRITFEEVIKNSE